MDNSDSESQSTEIPDSVIEALARCLLPKLLEYFESPEVQEEYERWKQQKVDTQ
jgi:hypothetical protein